MGYVVHILGLLTVMAGITTCTTSATCPRITIENGNVKMRSRNRVAKFRCRQNFMMIEGDRMMTCRLGAWHGNIPKCIGSGCDGQFDIPHGRSLLMFGDALAQFECDRGYELVGSAVLSCNGRRWNTSSPECTAPAHSAYDCPFETSDLCQWSIEGAKGWMRWQWSQGPAPVQGAGTRPRADHTVGDSSGKYLYVDGSSMVPTGTTTRLYSPILQPFDSNPSCVTFWVNMRGPTSGELKIYLKPESEDLDIQVFEVSLTGDLGKDWRVVYISLQDIDEPFQVVIEAVWGDGYMSDIAVDDFLATVGMDCIATELQFIRQKMADDNKEIKETNATAYPLDDMTGATYGLPTTDDMVTPSTNDQNTGNPLPSSVPTPVTTSPITVSLTTAPTTSKLIASSRANDITPSTEMNTIPASPQTIVVSTAPSIITTAPSRITTSPRTTPDKNEGNGHSTPTISIFTTLKSITTRKSTNSPPPATYTTNILKSTTRKYITPPIARYTTNQVTEQSPNPAILVTGSPLKTMPTNRHMTVLLVSIGVVLLVIALTISYKKFYTMRQSKLSDDSDVKYLQQGDDDATEVVGPSFMTYHPDIPGANLPSSLAANNDSSTSSSVASTLSSNCSGSNSLIRKPTRPPPPVPSTVDPSESLMLPEGHTSSYYWSGTSSFLGDIKEANSDYTIQAALNSAPHTAHGNAAPALPPRNSANSMYVGGSSTSV